MNGFWLLTLLFYFYFISFFIIYYLLFLEGLANWLVWSGLVGLA